MLIEYKTYIIYHLNSFFINTYENLKLLLRLYILYIYENILLGYIELTLLHIANILT